MSRPWRIVADDAPHVISIRFDTETDTRHQLNVVGARTRYADLDCSRRVFTIGARLRPGALPTLFGVRADELTNRSVAAELLVRGHARRLLAALEMGSLTDAASHLTSFLAELTVRRGSLDARARHVADIGRTDAYTVRDVATVLGLGERGLRSWSATHLGLGLRRFIRIRRLHAALERRLACPTETWSRIAATTGFADQPHLVRDCRALLGESPGQFFARAS